MIIRCNEFYALERAEEIAAKMKLWELFLTAREAVKQHKETCKACLEAANE